MKRLMKMFEDIMVAVTFAEAGEFDTARDLMGDGTGVPEELTYQGSNEILAESK